MLHMSSGVVALVVAAITVYITHKAAPTVSVSKVTDESTVTSPDKRPLRCMRTCFRSASLLNRTGFVVSFILIMAANFVMLNAKLVSDKCR